MNQHFTGSGGLSFYITPAHTCSYFSERNARTVFADPTVPQTTALYSRLSANGFRRSGSYVYRPQCPGCNACVPVRVPVKMFRPNRAQRRNWKANQDLTVVIRGAAFDAGHFALYRRYIQQRHPGGGMDVDDANRYMEFLSAPWADSRYVEFRLQGRLLAVAVIDVLSNGLSAVYTFFDPDEQRRGLGVFAVLWQIQHCEALDLDWLYLGYWIDGCDKMQYKQDYRPQQRYLDGRWRDSPGQKS